MGIITVQVVLPFRGHWLQEDLAEKGHLGPLFCFWKSWGKRKEGWR